MSERRIRVLLIAPSPSIVGGQGVQAERLLEGLRQEPGLALTFLPIDPPFPGPLRALRDVKYVRTVLNFFVFNFLLLTRLWRTDILHIFTAAHYSYLLWTVPSIAWGRLFGRKVLVNYHDGRCEDHLRRWKIAIPTLRLADAIVTPSGYLVDVLARFGLPARAIFNFLDSGRFRFRERFPTRAVFMTNRGLEPLYNVECLLRAFALIQQRFPEASLTVAHDGPCRARLEAFAARLGLRQTKFVGRIPQAEIASLYDAADIYLMTPNIDNMPLTVLECFASGLPVIATRAGGVPFIIRDQENGLLVDLNDHVAAADAAFRLLAEPNLARDLARNGRRELERYRWEGVRQQWLNVYAELAGDPNHAPPEKR